MNELPREENQLAVVQPVLLGQHQQPALLGQHLCQRQSRNQKKMITAKMKVTVSMMRALNGGKMMQELGGTANKVKQIGPNGKTENQFLS
jgi:hypothetical protein